jgi:hypothetical protein
MAFLPKVCYTLSRKFLKFDFEKIIAHGKLLVRVGRKTIGSRMGVGIASYQWFINPFCPRQDGFFYRVAP